MKALLFDQMGLNARKELVPLCGMFELTPRCSLDCKMCYVHLTDAQMKEQGKREITTEEWIKIIDEAVDAGCVFPLLSGGECLMHKGFKEIYLHLKQKPVSISINTNATLLNDDYVDFFAKNPPARIKVTLYGMSEDGYEHATGHRSFSRVRDAILKLKQAGVVVRISVTVCRYTYDESAEIVRFAIENDIPYNIDMAMVQADEGTGRNLDDYGLTAEEITSKYLEMYKIMGFEPYNNPPIDEIPTYIETDEKVTGLRCASGRGHFVVRWDGNLQGCLWVPTKSENVLEVGFKEAWKAAIMASREQPTPIECESCVLFNGCTMCPILRADPKDPNHCNPQVCAVTLAKYNAGIFKITKKRYLEDMVFDRD